MFNENDETLVEILKNENAFLKEGLLNIQKNLSESVSINSQTLKDYEVIQTELENLVNFSRKIRSESNDLLVSVRCPIPELPEN